MAGPLIVAAELAAPQQSWLEGLRQAHFPPERLKVGAHLTLFHALPPSVEDELRGLLADIARQSPPSATIEAPYSLGRGVAFRVRSPSLEEARARIADHFHGLLTAQDSAGWRGHVTVQNKVEPAIARTLLTHLGNGFSPRPTRIVALGLYRYEGGPWSPLGRYPFRG